MVMSLMAYLQSAKQIQDSRLLDLMLFFLQNIERIQMERFPEGSLHSFKVQFYSAVGKVLKNKYLPVRVNAEIR